MHQGTPNNRTLIPRPSPILWVNHCGPDECDCHTQPRRFIVPNMVATPLAPGCVPWPDIKTVWACPTPVYTHTARRCTNNTHTHNQGHRAVCPSATHMSIRERDRTKPNRKAATAKETHWCQSTMWRGHTRSTTSPKEGKRRGCISKGFCAKTDLCPLASPRVAQHEVRQGDTHDSGSAAIRGVPLPNPQRKICDGPVRVTAPR